MSDYVDTVDIEGAQYDIQDTATKQTANQNTQDIENISDDVDQIKTLPNWQTTTLNGCTIKYRKINHTMFVTMYGALQTAIPVGGVLFTLPPELRVSQQMFISASLSQNTGLLQIDPDGRVFNSGANTQTATICFTTFSYSIE